MISKILFSGTGGQGIQLASRLFAQACMQENFNVSLIPSYGAEMRGGNTTCNVVISDEIIPSPIFDKATHALLLSQGAFNAFKDSLEEGGMLVFENSIKSDSLPKNISVIKLNSIEIADKEIGNMKFLNMVALGAFIKATNMIKLKSLETALIEIVGEKNKEVIDGNVFALNSGYEKGIII